MLMTRVLPAALLALASAVSLSAQTTFAPRYAGFSGFPGTILQVDLNNDGIPDFIAGWDRAQELLSTGSGSYQRRDLPTGSYIPLASGDFNNDGKADVLFYNFTGGSQLFDVGYGDGTGGFTFKPVANLPGFVTGELGFVLGQSADINGDGRPDVVVAYYSSGSINVRAYINTGTTFTLSGVLFSYKSPNGSIGGNPGDYTPPADLLVGDYDADGHADFALRVLAGSSQDNLWILYGDGQGHLTSKAVYTNRQSEFVFAAADINDDGYSDLVGTNADGSIHIFRGTTGRTFSESSIPATTLQHSMYTGYAPVVADLDGNGYKDVGYAAQSTVTNSNQWGLRAIYQTASHTWNLGSFNAADTFTYYNGWEPFYTTAVGDYNHDAKPDVTLFSSDAANTHPYSADLLLNTGTHPVGSCAAPAIGIHVCSPGGSSASPVHFSFSATSFYPLRKMEVWVDGVKKSETYHVFANQGFSDVSLSLSAGSHQVAFFSGTYDGGVTKKTMTVTVP